MPYPSYNGGSAVEFLELWVDEGDNFSSAFTKLANYDGLTAQYTTVSADGLTLGATYRFISRAKNTIGYSEFSSESFVAFGNTPNIPDPPTMVTSSRTSITMAWTEPLPSQGDLTTTGYILNMDNGYISELVPVYIGTNQIDVF